MRQEFVRLRLRAICMLSSLWNPKNAFADVIYRDFESECDFNELSMELIEIVESHSASTMDAQNDGTNSITSSPNRNTSDDIPIDIKILAILALKQHISVASNSIFAQCQHFCVHSFICIVLIGIFLKYRLFNWHDLEIFGKKMNLLEQH